METTLRFVKGAASLPGVSLSLVSQEGAEKLPMGWAMTTANLGAVRMLLAEVTDNADIALLALNDFDDAVNYFQLARHSQYMELGEEQRKSAQTLVTSLNGS